MKTASQSLTLRAETLSGIDIFRTLSAADRQQLAPLCQYRRYRSGAPIVSYHEQSRDVFFIISGTVQATIYAMSGKQVALQDLKPGQMFGELSAIDGEPRSAHVIASSEAHVASMSCADFQQTLLGYPTVAEATLKRLAAMVRFLSERVFQISTLPVRQRVRAELLRLALSHSINGNGNGNSNGNGNGNEAIIRPAPTHADIANHIGTHREAVSREFARLSASGLLDRQSQTLIVRDVNGLAHLVHNYTE